VVVAGPSGVGKSSVVAELRRALPEMHFSVSVSTCAPRPGEVDGRDYRFVDSATFDRMVSAGELLEWAEIHGGLHRSGTPREPIERHLAAGEPVLLELDLQGARAVRSALPEAVLVFIEPPSWDELARRLAARGTESAADLDRRLDTAREELRAKSEFDIAVVNDDLHRVVGALVDLLVGPAASPGAVDA
jgi:guanylate kinase